MSARWFRSLCSRRVLLGLVVIALLLGLGSPQVWAWSHLRSARKALVRYHPESAQAHLRDCLFVWPDSVEVHLLSSRAARQSDDLAEADRQLRTCQRLVDGTSDDIALEWALQQAAGGNLGEVEEFLQRAAQDPTAAPLVWEALAVGYINLYRILDALACLDHWLRIDPDNLRALELRGFAYHHGKSASKGASDLQQVIEREPQRETARWRLVLCLLDMGSYDDALTHLEAIDQKKPGDPEVLVRMARCYNMGKREAEARQILDRVLEEHPNHALALRTRGQFALMDKQPAQAEHWLHQATKVWPNDYLSHHLLANALQQQHKTAQAKAETHVAEEIKDRVERLGELRSRKMSEQPLDPSLHHEMGLLLLRSGHKEVGVRWLHSALSLDGGYRPAHAALADYYEQQGDSRRAAEHRRQAR